MKAEIEMLVGVVLAAAAWGEATTGRPEIEEVASSTMESLSLDLSSVWYRQDLSPMDVFYAADGWYLDDVATGNTVSLDLIPVDGGATMTIASGLTGNGSFRWTPVEVERKQYKLDHVVRSGGAILSAETLSARFSFENCVMPASEAEIRAAVLGVTHECAVISDADNPWQPIGEAGEGVESVQGVASPIAFKVKDVGTFSFDWSLENGPVTVQVDGQTVKTYSSASDWAGETLSIDTAGEHVVTVSVASGDAGMKLRNVRWITTDEVYGEATSDSVPTDFREGVRVLKDRAELLPFVYSSTNFVGLAGADAESICSVEVVRLTGEGEDVSLWREEVPGSRKVLVRASGESAVVWHGKVGVWKATFEVSTAGGETVHEETAIFDMRSCARGLAIILR